MKTVRPNYLLEALLVLMVFGLALVADTAFGQVTMLEPFEAVRTDEVGSSRIGRLALLDRDQKTFRILVGGFFVIRFLIAGFERLACAGRDIP